MSHLSVLVAGFVKGASQPGYTLASYARVLCSNTAGLARGYSSQAGTPYTELGIGECNAALTLTVVS